MNNHLTYGDRYSPNLDIEGSMPDGVKAVFEPLRYEVTWLHAKWLIYQQLFCRDQQRVDLMNRLAPGFFVVVADSLRTESIVGLCRLTDPAKSGSNQNLTLLRLAEAVTSEEPGRFASDVDAEANRLRHAFSPLRTWRNKRLAHTDFPTAVDMQTLPEIPQLTIDNGLAGVRGLMNLVEVHYLNSEFCYDQFTNLDDGDELIFYLSEAERYDEERRRRRQAKSTPLEGAHENGVQPEISP